ncbi:MAG: DUF45 domain-containing protein [Deltaproteobacteria bacterium]|nr:DUF45 domain-containing protein [Deltaproteobacteria bacterium]
MPIIKKSVPLPAVIDLDNIGPVTFVASARAQRLNISVKADGGIRVALPKRATLVEAQSFVLSKQLWIQKQLVRLQKVKQKAAQSAEEIKKLDIDKASAKISARLQELAREHNFSFNRLTIRNQKTRWGSCSAKNNLSLNIKLALLPAELMDLVLVHELIHTKIKNHGTRFWQKLEEICPRARELDRHVNSHSGLLHLPL